MLKFGDFPISAMNFFSKFLSIFDFPFQRQRISTLCLVSLVLLSLSVVSQAQAIDEEEPDPVAIFNQGQDAHEKGDLPAAVKFYEQALKIVPEFPEAEFQRGAALLSLGKTDEAEKSFRRAAALRAIGRRRWRVWARF
jgi:tetratricopeptide (TPR) repeat protein